MKRLLASAGLLALAFPPAIALAWDRPTHASIALGAFRLAPGLEATILPPGYREGFLRNVEQGDTRDKDCLEHRGPRARHPAHAEAARIFLELTGPSAEQRPYQRSLLLGSFLHYVADTVVPNSLASGQREFVPDFFANKDFVIFREARELPGDIAKALETRSAAAQWGEEVPGSLAATYRLAINTTLDAISRVSEEAAASVRAAPVFVVFLVNAVDNATGGRRAPHNAYYGVGRSVGDARADLLGRDGVQLVEWWKRPSGSKSIIRALLYNNRKECSSNISIESRAWTVNMRETKMAPFALQRVEFEIPAEAPVPDLSSRAAAFDCPDPAHPNTYSAAKRLVLNAGVVPRYEGEIRDAVAPAESTPARIRTNR
jgi:hypothetical protein